MIKYKTLAATKEGRKGPRNRAGNQDRMLVRTFNSMPGGSDPVYLLAVADGISQCSYGGSVARYLVERHLQTDEIFKDNGQPLHEQLLAYIAVINAGFYTEFADTPDMLTSGCTLSLALFCGDHVDCFWVGDSPVFISRAGGNSYVSEQLSVPDLIGHIISDCFGNRAPCTLKRRSLTVGAGDIVTIVSDGVKHDADMLGKAYQEYGFTQRMAASVTDYASRSAFHDDISLAAAKRIS